MKQISSPDAPETGKARTASDNLCKLLAERYPEQLLAWLFGVSPGPTRMVKSELNREPVRADAAILLESRDELFHLEFQTTAQSHIGLPLRMLDYYVGFKRAFPDKDIRQALIVLKDTGEEVADCYNDGRAFLRYDVARMWEQDANELLQYDGLLALAVLCRADAGSEKLLREVAARIEQLSGQAAKREQLAMSKVLAGLRYAQKLVYGILLGGNMLEESVVYQDILQHGVKLGRQETRQEWLEREQEIILRQLTQRFGRLPPKLRQRVKLLPLNKLESLFETLLTLHDKTELDAWLNKVSVK